MKKQSSHVYLIIAGIIITCAAVAALLMTGKRSTPTTGGHMRIVSLAPNITEILFAIGAGDMVVAVSENSDWPPEAKKLPQIGGVGKPNPELLLSLKPDLIIGVTVLDQSAYQPAVDAGAKLLLVDSKNFDEMFDSIITIGQAVGRQAQAADLVKSMRDKFEMVRSRSAAIPPTQQPRVFIELFGDQLTTVGKKSFLSEMISLVGGRNVADEIPSGYPVINPEKVIEWNPDVILLVHKLPPGVSPKDALSARIGWSKIKAVADGRIIAGIDDNLLLRPGPRLVDGVCQLSEQMSPRNPTSAATSREATSR